MALTSTGPPEYIIPKARLCCHSMNLTHPNVSAILPVWMPVRVS
jgi:hypothetical protein